MKLETTISTSKEVFIEAESCTIAVNTWANHEGANLMVLGADLQLRMAGAFRWEEIDALLVALAAARAA